jgi:LmbE family N-acetylglucosaminyl deacetylase
VSATGCAQQALDAPRCLFVSPHLDDAVLSAGGLLAEREGRNVETAVLTIFAGVPPEGSWSAFAAKFHAICGLKNKPVNRRRAEDRRALAELGAMPWHGYLLEAIYRRSPNTGWLYDGQDRLFAARAPEDEALVPLVRRVITAACLRLRPNLMLGPRAIGNHVDHVIVSEAVRAVGIRLGVPVWLWEDQPYALRDPGATRRAPIRLAISPNAWDRRIMATGRYTSQMRMLFDLHEHWPRMLNQYAISVGTDEHAELYWPV